MQSVNILPAIRRLYDAATDAEKWPAFLQELAHCFDGNGAHIIRVQPRERALTFSVLYGKDDAMLRLYASDGAGLPTALARFERHFAELMPTDPRVRLLEQYPSRPLSCRMSIPDAEMHNSASYKVLLEPCNVEYTLAVSAPEDDGSLIMFAVFRGKEASFFREHELEAFGELIPHVKQAIALSEQFARMDLKSQIALEALESVAIGIVVLDEAMRVVHANAAAQSVIRSADGVHVQNGVLKVGSDDKALREAVARVIAQARIGTISGGEALSIRRPSGKDPYSVMIGTLWRNHLRLGVGRLDQPLSIVFLTAPEKPQEAPSELLRRLFGLTLTEAKVCERLVKGSSIEEASKDLAISTETGRVHLRNIFRKTGVNRQSDLLAKILATPVWIYHRARDRTDVR
jgi:DNA-binding CsgD family transcriptional regulator